ncbi:MAG: glycosyltransferase family 4 protein [Candidatus Eremiobacteraeota bacterium]|nr:glycosyltransferase family 4 protein [Candidatus Eremiobacteraeota bacterium]
MVSLPENAVLLSFEGPDPYSMVGGLGTRVSELSAALAEADIKTTLIFVGDPNRPPISQPHDKLEYRRWCQWISTYYPNSVYEGEIAKMNDYTASVPSFVAEDVVAAAAARRESVLVLAEDWQTAPSVIALDAILRERGLREHVIMVWNANNTFGFHTIDWSGLQNAARITTVSRYMKYELQAHGVDALVIPNGIPERLLEGAEKKLVRVALKGFERRRPLFVKIARFDEDKRWLQVVDAFANVVSHHPEATLVMRGGREEYGAVVLEHAGKRGLYVADLTVESRDPSDVLEAIASAPGSIVHVRSFIPEAALLALYHTADAVLANSGREPFGLVGLEVMAVGGLAVTGSTGEDYVEPFRNGLVCDTAEPRELTHLLEHLLADHDRAMEIAASGEATARRYTWPLVLDIMSRKLADLSAESPESVAP